MDDQERLTLVGRKAQILGIAMSRDGRYAATASADKTVSLWDLKTGLPLRRFLRHGRHRAPAGALRRHQRDRHLADGKGGFGLRHQGLLLPGRWPLIGLA